MEQVEQFLASIFNESDVKNVSDALRTLGAETLADIQLLDAETELTDVLPVLKRRRLSTAIKSQLTVTGYLIMFLN